AVGLALSQRPALVRQALYALKLIEDKHEVTACPRWMASRKAAISATSVGSEPSRSTNDTISPPSRKLWDRRGASPPAARGPERALAAARSSWESLESTSADPGTIARLMPSRIERSSPPRQPLGDPFASRRPWHVTATGNAAGLGGQKVRRLNVSSGSHSVRVTPCGP